MNQNALNFTHPVPHQALFVSVILPGYSINSYRHLSYTNQPSWVGRRVLLRRYSPSGGKMKELRFVHSESFKLLNRIEGYAIYNCNFLCL